MGLRTVPRDVQSFFALIRELGHKIHFLLLVFLEKIVINLFISKMMSALREVGLIV